MLSRASRYMILAVVITFSPVLGAPPIVEAQQSPSPLPGGPMPSVTEQSAGQSVAMGMMEGAVKKVDPAGGTVQVSWGPFGIFGKTLGVTDGTQVQVQGRQGSLADLREGAWVKAAYEKRDGRDVATQIEVMPAQESPGQKDGASQAPAKTQ